MHHTCQIVPKVLCLKSERYKTRVNFNLRVACYVFDVRHYSGLVSLRHINESQIFFFFLRRPSFGQPAAELPAGLVFVLLINISMSSLC